MKNISHLIDRALQRDSGKLAFTFHDDTVTYQQINHHIRDINSQFSAAFEAQYILAVWLPNGTDFICTTLAAFRAGQIPMPIHFESKFSEVLGVLNQARPRYLIVTAEKAATLTRADFIGTSVEQVWCLAANKLSLLFDLRDDAKNHPLASFSHPGVRLVLNTSGTTGKPKAVAISDHGLVNIVEDRVATAGITCASTAMVASCLSHSVGLYQVLAYLSQGASFDLLIDYDVDLMVDMINKRHPSHLIMVVSAFQQILDHPDINGHSFCNISFASVGADRVTQQVQDAYRGHAGKNLSVSYGMTELSWILVNKEEAAEHCLALGTSGAGTDVELRDGAGNPVRRGATGELFARSNKAMDAYLIQGELQKMSRQDDWIRSGDLAYKDESGLYWFAGRSTDLIVLSSGDNVSPVEVEQVILTVPWVMHCVVLGMLDETNESEVIWALISCSDQQPVDLDKIETQLNSSLSDYKHPRAYFYLDKIPTGVSGKVSRLEAKKWCMNNRLSLRPIKAAGSI